MTPREVGPVRQCPSCLRLAVHTRWPICRRTARPYCPWCDEAGQRVYPVPYVPPAGESGSGSEPMARALPARSKTLGVDLHRLLDDMLGDDEPRPEGGGA